MPVENVAAQFAPRVQSPMDVQNALAQGAVMQNQLTQGRMQVQQAQNVMQQRNALQQAVQAGQIDLANPEHASRALTLAPDVAPALLKTVQEGQQSAAKAGLDRSQSGKADQETSDAALKTYRSILPMVKTPEQFGQWVDGMYSNPATAKVAQQFGTPEQIKARIPQDPAAFQDFLQQNAVGMDEFIKNKTAIRGQDITRQNSVDTNATHVQTTGMTNATTLKATAMREGSENARAAEQRKTQLTIAGLSPDGSFAGSANPGDTERQLNFWADVVKKGGTLPPGLARGANGSAFVREVTKRAAMGDTTPSDLMANQAEFGGAKAGQRTLGTKQANIEMAANEAYNMIPIALAASSKVDRTQFPNLNAIFQAAEKGTGDTNVVQLATATNSLINSYSRAISPSGTPTVSDKEHAREILDKAFSKGQYGAAVDIMKQEIEAARKSPTQVRANMRGEAPSPAPAPSGFKYIGPAPAGK